MEIGWGLSQHIQDPYELEIHKCNSVLKCGKTCRGMQCYQTCRPSSNNCFSNEISFLFAFFFLKIIRSQDNLLREIMKNNWGQNKILKNSLSYGLAAQTIIWYLAYYLPIDMVTSHLIVYLYMVQHGQLQAASQNSCWFFNDQV